MKNRHHHRFFALLTPKSMNPEKHGTIYSRLLAFLVLIFSLIFVPGIYVHAVPATSGGNPVRGEGFSFSQGGVAPTFTSADSTTFTVGTAGSFSVTASGTPPPTIILASGTGSLPNGVTFSNGTLSGTPAAGAGGLYRLHFTASNGVSPDADEDFTLTVDEAPSFTSATTTTFTVGTLGTFGVNASGYPVPTVQLTTGTLPSGVNFLVAVSPGSSLLTGPPAAGTGGSYTLHFTASNGVSPDATQTFTLYVGVAPAFTSGSSTTFTVGTAGSFSVTASGTPPPTISLNGGSLPNGLTFSGGVLSGTPAAGAGGLYHLHFTASNGISPDDGQDFTLTVDEAPSFTSATTTTFPIEASGNFTVTTSGYPAPRISLTSGTLPTGVTFDGTDVVGAAFLSGTPAAGTGGSYTLHFTASNGVSPDATQTFTLNVTETPPAFTSANNTTFTVDTAGSFPVTASGSPTPTISLTTGTLPTGVTFNGGVLSGTPVTGTGGVYTLHFSASNGVTPDATQTFTLTVNESPAFTSADHTTFTVGTSGSFNVSASGYPAPQFKVTQGSLPSGVTLSISGVLSGTPATGTGGVHTVTITSGNAIAPNATQNFTLTVNEAPAFTSGNSTTFTVGANGTFNITTSGYPASSFHVTSGTLSNGVTLSLSGTLSGTPAAGTGNVYNLTISASNGIGSGVTQVFTLTVTQSPALVNQPISQTVCATQPVSFSSSASGYPAPSVQWQENSGNIVGATNPMLTFNAALSQNGHTFHAVFTNTATPSTATSQNATLTVNTVPTITVNPSSQTVILSQTATFTAAATNSATVQWKVSSGTTFTNVSGATNPTLSFVSTLADSGHRYEAVFSNGCGSVTTTAATLIVRQIIITLSPARLNTMKVGVPFSQTVIAAGGSAPYSYTLDGTLPPGLSFAAGVISGTPTAIGDFTFRITAIDTTTPGSPYSATQPYGEKVDPPTVLLTPNSPLSSGKVGTPYSVSFTASGGTGPYTYTGTGALPAGMTFSGGSLSGTPTAAGTFSFSITATDSTTGAGAPASTSKVYSLTIAP